MSILLLLLAVTCVSLWVIVAGSRWGSLLAVPTVTTAVALLIIVALTLTPFLPIPMGVAVVAVLAVAAIAAAVLLVRFPGLRRRPSTRSLTIWLSASIGALIWLAVRIASMFVPGAAVVSWAMEGDATNNLHFARMVVANNGILLSSSENPVPVTAAATSLPLSLASTWGGVGTGGLEPQIASFGWVWTTALMLGCVVMGVICASLLPEGRTALTAAVAGIGSLLPLTWFVGGLPIDFGYFNMPFATGIALASWLVFTASARAPLAALTTLIGCAILLLLTWSPVLLIPAGLGTVIALRNRSSLRAVRGVRLVALIAAVAVFAAFAVNLTLPALLVSTEALQAPGQAYPQSSLVLFALIGASLGAGALLRRRLATPVFPGIVALVISSYAAIATMLFISRDLFDPWNSYYAAKIIWLVCVVFMPVTISLVAATAATTAHRRTTGAAIAVTMAGALVAVAAFAPVAVPSGYTAWQPAERILGGHVWYTGDAAVPIIAGLAQRDEVAILWQSESPDEALINYWAIDAAGGAINEDDELRAFSYYEYSSFRHNGTHDAIGHNALCRILRDTSRSVVVYTANPRLEEEFAENCTGASAEYRLGDTPGLD